jgi:microcystin degradation protein MlrC
MPIRPSEHSGTVTVTVTDDMDDRDESTVRRVRGKAGPDEPVTVSLDIPAGTPIPIIECDRVAVKQTRHGE